MENSEEEQNPSYPPYQIPQEFVEQIEKESTKKFKPLKELLQAHGVEEADMYETKTFFTEFFFATMAGKPLKAAIKDAILQAQDVIKNPDEQRPPLPTRSYLTWRDALLGQKGPDGSTMQRGAFPPAPSHLRMNQIGI